ncbi:RNase H domain-containing protein [Abeliophyllum distichum]|uniref:RNase H domain-containing protein n=1 Tax=Abeliophyllum distichum TaxID=126358 RepID=A0ABD1SAF8_9LAMI
MWKDTPDGRFSTKSAWQLVRTGSTLQGLVPVDVIIQKRIRVHRLSRCQCCSEIETIQHVFIDSLVAHQVWQHFSTIFGIPLKVGEMLQHRFQTWKFSGQFVKGGHIRTIILLLVLWFIWTARNDASIVGLA